MVGLSGSTLKIFETAKLTSGQSKKSIDFRTPEHATSGKLKSVLNCSDASEEAS